MRKMKTKVEEIGAVSDSGCATPSNGEHSANENSLDLVIIGGGSAAFAAAIKTSELGGRAVIVNDGLPIGGTCVNVGCVPSKTLIRAAEANHRSVHHAFSGIQSRSEVTDFGSITAQAQSIVRELREGKYFDVVADDPNIEIVEGHAYIVDANTVSVGTRTLCTKNVLIATGAHTYVPSIPGLAEVDYLTNETAYKLEVLPEHLIVLGGRYIALENAQLFARLGAKITVLQRSDRIIPTESNDLSDDLDGYLRDEGVQIITGVSIQQISNSGQGVSVDFTSNGQASELKASHIFLATGREGNTREIGLEALGIETIGNGYLTVDDTLRTSVPNIFGAGDVLGEHQFVYTAAYEGSLSAENAIGKMHKPRDYSALPWVIFTDPQVAGIGMDEGAAEAAGINFEVSKLSLEHVPRSMAARDTRGFIKLIRNADTDLLIGARILAPEGSELLMELALAIKYGITVTELKSAFHPYLTLSEGIKLAAITFGKDVSKLSCCAV